MINGKNSSFPIYHFFIALIRAITHPITNTLRRFGIIKKVIKSIMAAIQNNTKNATTITTNPIIKPVIILRPP